MVIDIEIYQARSVTFTVRHMWKQTSESSEVEISFWFLGNIANDAVFVGGVEANLGPLAEQDKIDQCYSTWQIRTGRVK
jgi:hypothetical protein